MTPLRWTFAVLTALTLAAATGGAAAWLRDDDPLLSFLAFGLMTLPVWLGFLWLLLDTSEPAVPHQDETVESQWFTQASSAAFLDLVIALGVTTAATSIADLSPLNPMIFLALAMADVAVRYLVLQRREA